MHCDAQTANALLDDMRERQRLSYLCDCELIEEVLADDEVDIDHPLISELLSRLDPRWSEMWGERELNH